MATIRPFRVGAWGAIALVPALLLASCGPDAEKVELRRKLAEAEARAEAAEHRAATPAPQPVAPPPPAAADAVPFGQPLDDTRPIDLQPGAADGNPAPVNPGGGADQQHFKITP